MSLHMHDLDFADTIIGTNIFIIRQGGSTGEDRQATLNSLKTFILSDSIQIDIDSPRVEISGNINVGGEITISGTPIIDYVSTNHNHDNLYFSQTFITAQLAGKSSISHTHNDLYYQKDDIYSVSEIDVILADFQTYFQNNLPDHNHDNLYYQKSNVDTLLQDLENMVSIKDGGVINGSLEIDGDLTINGTTTTVNTQILEIEDNIIEINSNQIGTPSVILKGGLEINRGDEPNYQLLFVENDQNFQIGEIDSLQPVATREDSPLENGYAKWNDSQKRFDTTTLTEVSTEVKDTIFSELATEVKDEIFTELSADVKNNILSELVTEVKNEMFPIGSMYLQLPNMGTPTILNYPGTWTNVSADYAGDFFRVEGGNALAFEGGEQSDELKSHTHTTTYLYERYDTGGSSNDTGGDGQSSGSNLINATGGIETRPVNQTIRVWKRTA